MKRTILLSTLLSLCFALTACSDGLTKQASIIVLYKQNEDLFIEAAESKTFDSIKRIDDVKDVFVQKNLLYTEADIYFGGSGMGSSTSYYGIRYFSTTWMDSPDTDDYPEGWSWNGTGFSYREPDANGDNTFYYEPLGHGYFYYEEHY